MAECDVSARTRSLPNIAISGTPGVGKTTLAQSLARRLPELNILDITAESEKLGCRSTWDERLKSWEVDEDKLADELMPTLRKGGQVVDWMHADFLPAEALDLVCTVRSSNKTLYDRYQARGYSKRKIDENIDSEIFGEISRENEEAFKGLVQLWDLDGDENESGAEWVELTVDKLSKWVSKWKSGEEWDEETNEKEIDEMDDEEWEKLGNDGGEETNGEAGTKRHREEVDGEEEVNISKEAKTQT